MKPVQKYKSQIPTQISFTFSQKPEQQQQKFNWVCYFCLANEIKIWKFSQCLHEVICKNCAIQYIKFYIHNKKYPICPVENCKALMIRHYPSTFDILPQAIKNLWDQKSYLLQQCKISIKMVCKCQKQHCNGLLDVTNGLCKVCCSKYCLKCMQLAHISQNCLDLAIKKYKKDIKVCPKCNIPFKKNIQQIELFCYNCLTIYCNLCIIQIEDNKYHKCQKQQFKLQPLKKMQTNFRKKFVNFKKINY